MAAYPVVVGLAAGDPPRALLIEYSESLDRQGLESSDLPPRLPITSPEGSMRLAWMKRSVLPMMILFVLGCAQLPTGADEATVTLPADRMASQESNGDSIQYLGDLSLIHI